jgi:1-acyl-sn-glycerol-3-phosphate acyltransferase
MNSLIYISSFMLRVLRFFYLLWLIFWFCFGFFLVFPAFWWIIQRKKRHPYYHPLSRFWARLFYVMMCLPVKVQWEFEPDKNQTYIFCPNHFSFMDIPLLTLTIPSFFVFVGLHNLEKVPWFGYMYRNIHIPVNRGSLKSRYQTYLKTKEALQEGKNVVMFPEGGIWASDFPHMGAFKDGAFKIAIETQTPIVPVSIPYNWKIIPSLQFWKLAWHPSEIVFHQPILPQDISLDDLKTQTFQVIEKKLKLKCHLE